MKQKGFTIIELMVTLGIIAILGAIAVPQYNKYVTKTRITEALHHAQVYARKYESEAAGGGDAGTIPTLEHATISISGSDADTRVNATLKDSIDSQVLIDSDDTAGGKVLELGLEGSSGATRWVCKTNLSASKMPKVCTYSADAGAGLPVAWADRDPSDASLTACWEGPSGVKTVGRGVVGENSHAGSQDDVETCADGETPLSECTAGHGVGGTVRCSD